MKPDVTPRNAESALWKGRMGGKKKSGERIAQKRKVMIYAKGFWVVDDILQSCCERKTRVLRRNRKECATKKDGEV